MRLEPLPLRSDGLTWLSSRWLLILGFSLACLFATRTGGHAHAHSVLVPDDRGGSAARGVAALAEATCPAEVYEYPWPHDEACAVSWCESRWQADAIGGDNWGYFQLWSGWARAYDVSVRDLLAGPTNVSIAYAVWQREGWAPWACKP